MRFFILELHVAMTVYIGINQLWHLFYGYILDSRDNWRKLKQ